MALIKTKISKGISCEYWGLVDYRINKIENNTYCTLGLFQNHDTRLADIAANCFEQIPMAFEGLLSEADCYAKIKESHPVEILITPGVGAILPVPGRPAILDDNGVVLSPAIADVPGVDAIPAVMEQQETNFFTDAADA